MKLQSLLLQQTFYYVKEYLYTCC